MHLQFRVHIWSKNLGHFSNLSFVYLFKQVVAIPAALAQIALTK
jgi:hypothetical protein